MKWAILRDFGIGVRSVEEVTRCFSRGDGLDGVDRRAKPAALEGAAIVS
jgi:hypothetical protein